METIGSDIHFGEIQAWCDGQCVGRQYRIQIDHLWDSLSCPFIYSEIFKGYFLCARPHIQLE